MAREVQVLTWCDVHLSKGERAPGREVTGSLNDVPYMLALCDECYADHWAPMVALVTEHGQPPAPPVDAAGVASKPSRPHKRGTVVRPCPFPDCGFKGNAQSLSSHSRGVHDMHITRAREVNGVPQVKRGRPAPDALPV